MKKYLTILIGLMLIASAIAAPPMPFPIDGRITINGEYQTTGYEVKIENINTGAEAINLVQNGAYFYNLQKLGWWFGDTIRITACTVHPDCIHEFTIESSDPHRHNFNIVDASIPPTEYVCPDGSTIVTDVADCPEPEPEVVDKVTSDDLTASIEAFYGEQIDVKVLHNKLEKLLKEEIEFDGEDYDVHEELYFSGIVKTSIDDEDFGEYPYLLLEEGAVKYKFVFDDVIDLFDIDEDEPLVIVFLGKEIEIIEADDDKITVLSGEERLFTEDETFDGIKVITIEDDYAYINYNGESKKITEGETDDIGGRDFYVYEVIVDEDGPDYATIIYGDNVKQTVEDGDDFELFIEDDEVFRWLINLPDSVGIENQKEYIELDEDEIPLGLTQTFVFPNDYATIQFSEISETEMYDLRVKVKDDFLVIEGDKDVFDDDYDTVRVKADGIYNEDDELLYTDKIRIGDSDIFLERGSAIIGKLEILLDMADILYDAISFANKDEIYLDHFGIIFSDPEDAIDEQKGFEILVPEERPEVTITIGKIKVPVLTTTSISETTIPDTTTPTTVVSTVTTIPETTTTIPEEDDDSTLQDFLLGLIASIIGIFAWGKGFAGLIKWRLKKAKEADETGDKELAKKYRNTAEKMAKTTIFNFMAGKYKR